jgi:hypothetical protein
MLPLTTGDDRSCADMQAHFSGRVTFRGIRRHSVTLLTQYWKYLKKQMAFDCELYHVTLSALGISLPNAL